MSEDDFGTINVQRGTRAREIEVLRQHYRQHRDSLQELSANAPTEHLAAEYQRLVIEIDRSLGKLDELEGKPAMPLSSANEPARSGGDAFASQRQPAPAQAASQPQAAARDAGVRPSAPPPPPHPARAGLADPPVIPAAEQDAPRSRVPLIVAAALVALALIGWLIWRGRDSGDDSTIVEERPAVTTGTAEAGTSAVDDTIEPATPVAAGLNVVPVSHDYGTIRKGTRATRQYELANTTDEPMSINVARSTCRCLYYEHAPVIPPKAKETLTITVDGARAKAGTLHEQIRVTSKANAAVGVTVDVNATVQ